MRNQRYVCCLTDSKDDPDGWCDISARSAADAVREYIANYYEPDRAYHVSVKSLNASELGIGVTWLDCVCLPRQVTSYTVMSPKDYEKQQAERE